MRRRGGDARTRTPHYLVPTRGSGGDFDRWGFQGGLLKSGNDGTKEEQDEDMDIGRASPSSRRKGRGH